MERLVLTSTYATEGLPWWIILSNLQCCRRRFRWWALAQSCERPLTLSMSARRPPGLVLGGGNPLKTNGVYCSREPTVAVVTFSAAAAAAAFHYKDPCPMLSNHSDLNLQTEDNKQNEVDFAVDHLAQIFRWALCWAIVSNPKRQNCGQVAQWFGSVQNQKREHFKYFLIHT